jgi:hypothetical protein
MVHMAHEEMPGILRPETEREVAGWRSGVALFLVSLIILAMFSGNHLKGPSTDPHFVYLANTYNTMIAAMFGGAAAEHRAEKLPFELDRDPPHRNDWASYWELTLRDGEELRGNWVERTGQGPFKLLGTNTVVHLQAHDVDRQKSQQRYFVSFPPAPAWLMMPLAAIWGYEVHDVLFTLVFAALNIVLLFFLLERLAAGGLTDRRRSDNLWLTALFGFGSVHLWSAILGQVWFTALILGVTFTLAYLHCAIDAKRPLLAGVFLALGFATRTPLVFTAVFFFAFLLFPGGSWLGLGRRRLIWAARKLMLFCLPCLVVGLSLLWMNHVRFADWSEFGHSLLAGGMIRRIQEYGLFHWHSLSKNLAAAFVLVPQIQAEYPFVVVSRHGMSLFLTTPALLYLLWPLPRRDGREVMLHRLCWLTVGVVAMQHFLYQNTGYEQFGFRFSLDYMPYVMVLLALGRRPITRVFKACILVGVAVNAFGAITFKRMPQFFSNHFL